MPQTSNPYGFKLVYGKESHLSAGVQPYYIKSGYDAIINQQKDAAKLGSPIQLPGIGVGDPVTFLSTTNATQTGSIALANEPWGNAYGTATADVDTAVSNPTITNGVATYQYTKSGSLIGIFGGCSYQPDQKGQPPFRGMWQKNTKTFNDTPALAAVQDHPFLVWQVQTNGEFNKAYTSNRNTPIGLNYCFTYGSGVDTSTGQSRAQLFVYDDNVLAAAKTNSPIGQPAAQFNENAYFKIIGLAPATNGQTNNWTDPFVDVLVVINDHYLKAGTSAI